MRSMTHSKLHCDTAAGCNFEALFSVDWLKCCSGPFCRRKCDMQQLTTTHFTTMHHTLHHTLLHTALNCTTLDHTTLQCTEALLPSQHLCTSLINTAAAVGRNKHPTFPLCQPFNPIMIIMMMMIMMIYKKDLLLWDILTPILALTYVDTPFGPIWYIFHLQLHF